MSGASVTITIEDREVREGFARLAGVMDDTTPLMRAIGAKLVSNTQDRFSRGVDPDGGGWAALNPDYALVKRGPGILRESAMAGGLMGSITSDADRNSVTIGSNKVYAAIHQYGGTIKPKNGEFLRFRLGGSNARPVYARSVTIPARPYLGISAEDRQDIDETITDALKAAIPGR